MNAKRKLKSVRVNFISLVTEGATGKKIIYKNREGITNHNVNIPIKKTDEEKHLVYGIVYSPDETDQQGDTASREVIEEMAYSFLKENKSGNIDRQHNFNPGEGFIAESWIIRKNDPLFPDEKEGSWGVGIKIENPETWAEIKEGKICGLSLAGFAEVEQLEKQNILEKLLNVFQAGKEENSKEEIDKMIAGFEKLKAELDGLKEDFYSIQKKMEIIENSDSGSRQKPSITKNSTDAGIYNWLSGIELNNL